jgi:hypothetical protein
MHQLRIRPGVDAATVFSQKSVFEKHVVVLADSGYDDRKIENAIRIQIKSIDPETPCVLLI